MKPNVLPFIHPSTECMLLTATVKAVADGAVMVQTEAGVESAAIAFSCLVAPLAEDVVLLCRSGRESHILAVLERQGDNMSLDFPGSVSLRAPKGDIDLAASGELSLMGAEGARVVSEKVHILGAEVSVSGGRVLARAGEVISHIGQAQVFAEAIDTVAKRVTQRVDTLMRWVEGVETLSLGSLIQNVRRAMVSHSHHAVITATKDIKIDGERIHMG